MDKRATGRPSVLSIEVPTLLPLQKTLPLPLPPRPMEISPDEDDMILIAEHEDVTLHGKSVSPSCENCFMMVHGVSHNPTCPGLTGPLWSRFMGKLKQRLSPRLKNLPDLSPDPIPAGSHASVAQPWPSVQPIRDGSCADIMFVSHGPFGIVDLGASQTAIGRQQVPELLSHLPVSIRSRRFHAARCFDLVTAAQLSVKKPCWCLCRSGMSRFALSHHAHHF